MDFSRRDWTAALLPLLVGTAATAEADTPTHPLSRLPGKVYTPAEIPNKDDDHKRGGRIFFGSLRDGFNVEMHATSLGPGVETHAPHRHVHEEIIVMLEGTLQANVDGQQQPPAEPGGILFFASNVLHNAKNVGNGPCRYYVIELRGDNVS